MGHANHHGWLDRREQPHGTDRVVGADIQSLFTTTEDYASAGALSVILLVLILIATLVYVRRAGTEELL